MAPKKDWEIARLVPVVWEILGGETYRVDGAVVDETWG
jgi:hypothetical protein